MTVKLPVNTNVDDNGIVNTKVIGRHSLQSVALLQGKVIQSLQQSQYTKYNVNDRSNYAQVPCLRVQVC